jgi:hypothetical protein
VSGLAGLPSRVASRAPASPPSTNPIRRSTSWRRSLRCAWGRARAGSRSAKVLRGAVGVVQKKRRIWKERRTVRPLTGRSCHRL